MQDIIKISETKIGDSSMNSVSARELHKALGVRRDFSTWIKDRIKKYGFIENEDFTITTPQNGGVGKDGLFNGSNRVEYYLTLDMAKELAMIENSENGRKIRKYFIEVEKQFRTMVGKEQNGGLVSLKERGELITVSKNMFIDFEDVFYRIGITRPKELAVTSNRAVQKETGVDFIELAEKKGLSTPHKYFTVTELCQKVMDSNKFSEEAKKLVSTKTGDKPRPQNLNKILQTNGYQTKVDGVWKPTEKAKGFSDFVQNKSPHSEKTVFHLVWKVEILEELF